MLWNKSSVVLLTRKLLYRVEKEIREMCSIWSSALCGRNTDNDTSRWKEIRSHENVALELDGKDQFD